MAIDLSSKFKNPFDITTNSERTPTAEGAVLAVLENELDKNPKHGLNVNAVKGSISRLDRLGTKYQDMNDSDKTKAWVCAQKLLCRGQKEGRGDLCHKLLNALGISSEPKMSAVGEALIRIAPVGNFLLGRDQMASVMDTLKNGGSLNYVEKFFLNMKITTLRRFAERNGSPLSAGQEKLLASFAEKAANDNFEPAPLYGYDRKPDDSPYKGVWDSERLTRNREMDRGFAAIPLLPIEEDWGIGRIYSNPDPGEPFEYGQWQNHFSKNLAPRDADPTQPGGARGMHIAFPEYTGPITFDSADFLPMKDSEKK